LNGLLLGKNNIYEMIECRKFLFIEDQEIEGKFYVGDIDTFRPLVGDDRVFTKQQIEELKKRPNTFVIAIEWARKK
jgi:hypothetical protein